MGYIRRPAYYKAFRCIGSDCTENCCIGWEIDVDEDSLAYYETVSGDFGERLRASIAPADAQTGEPAHFRLDAEERCPLLNDCNLCEVLLHLGEDKMAQICTDHPRYYEWFSDGREDGLGLCCEAIRNRHGGRNRTGERAVFHARCAVSAGVRGRAVR